MQLSSFLKVTTLTLSLVSLSACSTLFGNKAAKTDSDQTQTVAVNAVDDVVEGTTKTYGIGDSDHWAESTVAQSSVATKPMNQTYYFNFDSSSINSTYIANIDKQADYLLDHPEVKIRIEGNTDERGSREYNIALGERRADAIADLLALRGVPKDQLQIVSYGQERPEALGHKESDYRLNRRAQITYISPKGRA